jgi:HEPN domain-containing protein
MSREINAKEWLRVAEIDRRAAKHLLDDGDYEVSVFHCQQAIEKLLKAVIVKQTSQRPPHTHEMRVLLERIVDPKIEEEIEQSTSRIGAYYVGSRYPLDAVDPDIFTKPLAESAVQEMEKLFQWFLHQINFEAE